MRVKVPEEAFTIHPQDIEMVYHSLMHFTDSLEKFRSRFDRYGEPMGVDTKNAKANIDHEIAQYQKLQLSIYEQCFSTPTRYKEMERT